MLVEFYWTYWISLGEVEIPLDTHMLVSLTVVFIDFEEKSNKYVELQRRLEIYVSEGWQVNVK